MEHDSPFTSNEVSITKRVPVTNEDTKVNSGYGILNQDKLTTSLVPLKTSVRDSAAHIGFKDQRDEKMDHINGIVAQNIPFSLDAMATSSHVLDLDRNRYVVLDPRHNNFNGLDVTPYDFEHLSDRINLALPNDLTLPSPDTNEETTYSRAIHSDVQVHNNVFNEDNSYSSGKIGVIKARHNWQLFEANEDKVNNLSTNIFNFPNGDLWNTVSENHIVSSNSREDSNSVSKTSKVQFDNNSVNSSSSSTNNSDQFETHFRKSELTKKQIHRENGNHIGRYSVNTSWETTDRQWSNNDIEAEIESHLFDTESDYGLIINASSLMHNSGRKSAPILKRSVSHGFPAGKKSSGYARSYSEVEHPVVPLFIEVVNRNDLSSQHIPHFFSTRPHSVATSDFKNNVLYNNTIEESFIDGATPVRAKRKKFALSSNTTLSSSMPEHSNIQENVPNFSDPLQKRDGQLIFKTPSSASLLSDSSLTSTPPISASRDSNKKLSRLKSMFSDKILAYGRMPIDDSMDFEIQPSILPSDETQTKDKNNSHKGQDHNAGKKDDKKAKETAEKVEEIELQPDAKPETKTAVYKRRWYLLFLFSVSAMLWNAVWSTWGPIAQSAKMVYDWTDGDIAMFIWLGNIPFLITMFPSAYLMDVKGMRMAMIAACSFMFLGAGFRCIPSDISTASWLIRIGQFLNGMAGTIPNSGPALLSGLWFPPNQRASATAISTVAGYMGASISFVIGPLLVPEPNDASQVNNTDDVLSFGEEEDVTCFLTRCFSCRNCKSGIHSQLDTFGVLRLEREHSRQLSDDYMDSNNITSNTTINYDKQKTGIMNILYVECGVAGLLLILVLIYFPSKPPLPPSISASIPREKYIKGLKMLIRNKQFWVCALAFSVPIGVYEAWQVILDVNLDSRGISQETAGWLDFYATLGGCVSGLIVSRFADFFTRQMKLFLLVFYAFASVAIMWFTLVVLNIIPFDHVSIYAAIIIAGVFLDGGGPLFFELTIEVSYPVGEGVTSGFTQMMCAAAGIVFLSVVQIESLGKEWMNWCFFGCVAIAIPLLFFIKTTYGRADIDDLEVDVSDDEEGTTNIEAIDSNEKTYLFGNSHV